jgi:hypothetical protein
MLRLPFILRSKHDAEVRQHVVAKNLLFIELHDAKNRISAFEKQYDEATDLEAKARYASPDGKKVLKDLQSALNYVRDYQRSLWVMLAPDNHYYQAKQLLEEWGMKPHSEVDETRTTAIPAIPGIPRDRTGSVEHDRYGLSLLNSGNDD